MAPAAPPSHLLPFNRPDLLSATHPSDHNAVHFQTRSKLDHKLAMHKYESLGRKKEHDIQKAAEKAAKQAAKDSRGKVNKSRPVYLSTLNPPHLQTSADIRTALDRNFGANARSPYGYGYRFPFLVPVPLFFGEGVGLGGCVAADGFLIDASRGCGSGGCNLNAGCEGIGEGFFFSFFSNYFI